MVHATFFGLSCCTSSFVIVWQCSHYLLRCAKYPLRCADYFSAALSPNWYSPKRVKLKSPRTGMSAGWTVSADSELRTVWLSFLALLLSIGEIHHFRTAHIRKGLHKIENESYGAANKITCCKSLPTNPPPLPEDYWDGGIIFIRVLREGGLLGKYGILTKGIQYYQNYR